MEASYEVGQGPEGAVAPYMGGWKDGWMSNCKNMEIRTGAPNVHHCPTSNSRSILNNLDISAIDIRTDKYGEGVNARLYRLIKHSSEPRKMETVTKSDKE